MANSAAAALGRMAKGIPKQFSADELALRAERLAANRYRGGRKPKPKNPKPIKKERIKTMKITAKDTIIGQYDMKCEIAIVEHPTHGRLLVTQGFGGIDELCGGAYRWRHGLVARINATDTLDSLRADDDPAGEFPSTLKAIMAYGVGREILPWEGNMIEKMMASATR